MKKFFTVLAAALLLSGCAKMEQMFVGGDDLPPLKGERISILQLQNELAPNTDLAQTPVVLPEPWTNATWPQAGGYPNHALGQLTLSQTPKKLWSADIGSGGSRRIPLLTQPIVADGLVYTLDTEGDLSAFDLNTGSKKWRVTSVAKGEEDRGGIGGGIAYSSGKIFVTNGYTQLTCFDAAKGTMLWRAPLPAPARSAPTVMNDRVYVITLDSRLMALSAADGSALWNYTGVTEATSLLGAVSPAADDTSVILPQASGEIFSLRAENGQPLWQDNLAAMNTAAGALASIADIRGQPVIDQGYVYAASYSGRTVAIDQTSGQRIWQREIGSAEMPWAAGANVFLITNEQQIVALTRDKGEVRWVTALPRHEEDDKDEAVVWTGPVLAGGRLIAASSDGNLVEVNPQDGKIIRTSELPGNVFIAPVVAANTLLILTQGGDLVAYR